MSQRSSRTLLVVLGVLTSLLTISPTPPAAAKAPHYYYAYAGGSQVTALGTTIRSDLTGRSDISGFDLPRSESNRIAGATVAKTLVKLGAISTWARARKHGGGSRIVTGGRTADISLLGGLIKADAVETNAVAIKTAHGTKSRARTKYLGLTIAGHEYPLHVSQNTTIDIPGIATVILNGKLTSKYKGTVSTYGFGLFVTLLKPIGRAPAGATVLLNPTMSAVGPTPPSGSPMLGGEGYGTFAIADADPLATAEIGRTAALAMPMVGTSGKVLRNTTAGIYVPGVLDVGAISTRTSGVSGHNFGRVGMTNHIADLNVFDGLIRAEALKVHAGALWKGKAKIQKKHWMKLVHLTIAGHKIPIDISPNTVIKVADLGKVTINKRVNTPYATSVVGVEVVLSKAGVGSRWAPWCSSLWQAPGSSLSSANATGRAISRGPLLLPGARTVSEAAQDRSPSSIGLSS